MEINRIRNFCIVAHIDHGKSTLADRLLQVTGTISEREMKEQVLDDMDLEREKGVTIKASAVRMVYPASDGITYEYNLIDTPGHVDFSYEVSRALQACEGAVLVVDASQGIEAQTLANLYLAMEADLEIIPIINKIDLISAQPDEVAQEIEDLIGTPAEDVVRVSAKEGTNVAAVLEVVAQHVPPPRGSLNQPLRALIFDSHYDAYKGVIAYVRVVDGSIEPNRSLHLMSTGIRVDPLETGVFAPRMTPVDRLTAGEVGYVATGLKTVRDLAVGDTLTWEDDPAERPLPGYRPMKPMVFAGLYPTESEDYNLLRDALEKLQLNDASLIYQPETSQALGFGFRCGFLGLFHMEIIQERLEREYDLDIIFTAPSVEYQVTLTDGGELVIDSPADLPDPSRIEEIREPWVRIEVFTPTEYIGAIMDMATRRRGEFLAQDYLDQRRVLLSYKIPLSEILTEFFNEMKARTRGYASMDYHFEEYRPADMVRLDVLVNEMPVDALSIIVHRDDTYRKGQRLVSKMKEVIPRQMFLVPVQAAVGNKIISRANVKPLRKDVLAKCYGGDITRKRKLLEKQKKGKRRMKMVGSVEIPQEAFLSVLRLDDDD
ncbi:MAG: elongation factor 4 [Caldilineae bacterium]|nr:translation elongation factor 4 [Anaerolineae bacterium]MCB0255892.1 translation elongation factor 4 [Anaerolineae bacterium]MCB9154714.1 elongation factor 4 [Caldilineae bacterium]